MANILDEQERKRKELAAQGIHTRGAPGAKGGPAEMTYKPLEQRTGAEAKALGVSPQMQGQIAQEQGLIPPAALPTPAVTPSQAPAPQARGVAPQAAGVTPQAQAANRQLDLMRQEGMGTTNTSFTQMASRIDPSIKRDAERARQWRLMTPQQRREEVDRLALEQDMRTADSVVSQDGIAKYARDLADPTGTFIDSYGRSNAIYSPETQIRIREHERKIESQAADMFSSYDRTKWATEKDMYYAVASLPAVQEAGDFGKAIAFNIVRKYASPEMKAKMEAEDRNLDVFKRTFKSLTDQEIDQMQQEMGGEYTNMGNEEFAKQIYINKDDNFRANSLVERVFERAGVRYTVENGRVVPDQGWAAQVKMREEERKAKDAADAKEKELRALEEYEDQRYAVIQQMNPERAAMMIKNPITRKYDDLSQYATKPPEEEKPIPPGARWTDEKRRKEHQEALVIAQNLNQFAEQFAEHFPGIKTMRDLNEQIAAWEEMRGEPDAATKYPGLPQVDDEFDLMVEKIRQDFDAVQKAGGLDGIRSRLSRLQSISWDEEEE